MTTEYITEKDLEALPLDELQAKAAELRRRLRDRQREFQDRKTYLIEELQVPINWYLARVLPSVA